MKKRLSLDEYVNGILEGNRVILSRAITLIESILPEDKVIAQLLIEKILPYSGNSKRIGVTGVPGVGKSTFIESFGIHLTSFGLKVAVLTIDPTSQKSKGSILGDKTRMEKLSTNPLAYIRPSASGSSLGGVAHKTRETVLLFEAAGFDVILIETVGVGQSEVAVKNMTDLFLLLMLAGAGDELQGIKRGIMEMADIMAITKSDGDNIKNANLAKVEYTNALHLLQPHESKWTSTVLTCSSTENLGIENIWNTCLSYFEHIKSNNYFEKNRASQNHNWFREQIALKLEEEFYSHPEVINVLPRFENKINSSSFSISKLVDEVFAIFHQ